MCTLYERIQELCASKGVSGSRMCLDLGLSKSTLSDIKSGRKKGVSTSTAQKIAAYFDVSVGYLLGEEELPETEQKNISPSEQLLTEGEKELIQLFRLFPEDQQKVFLGMVRSYANSLKAE